MRLYCLANARMPTEKAHGIHIAKMCEAFIEQGVDLVLLVPARGASKESLQEYYGLRAPVPTVRLWVPDLYRAGSLGYLISSYFFMARCALYLLRRREGSMLYSVDIDNFSFRVMRFLRVPYACEMHYPKKASPANRRFFAGARAIVATNALIAEDIKKTFAPKKIIIEPNGVDLRHRPLARDEARAALKLGAGKTALYAGRFYAWKGLEVLAPASRMLAAKGIKTLVLGGSKDEFERVFGDSGALHFAEAKPAEVGDWMYAADVLLLVGTAKNQNSNRYTAPMKVFEYLSTGRPVVASGTEALKSLLPGDAVAFCRPDDPKALARRIEEVLAEPATEQAAQKRISLALSHGWDRRAGRILAFIGSVDTLNL